MSTTKSRPAGPWRSDSLGFGEMLSPIGPLAILVGPRGLLRLDLPNAPPSARGRRMALPADLEGCPMVEEDERVDQVRGQLREYFAGQRRAFDLPLDLRGTDFHRAVWAEVAKIPYGRTASYLEIARSLGNPHATRAVGAANGRNPVPIVVPCHRVIGAGGKLTGYGGGVAVKARLLKLEGSACEAGA